MNPTHAILRSVGILAGIAGALLVSAASGLPGWQITLIAATAVVLAAARTVLLARARATRRRAAASPA